MEQIHLRLITLHKPNGEVLFINADKIDAIADYCVIVNTIEYRVAEKISDILEVLQEIYKTDDKGWRIKDNGISRK